MKFDIQLKFFVLFGVLYLSGCSNPTDDLNSGGLTPPPGFLEQADADCRAASEVPLPEQTPTPRQLNGQTLLGYALEDGRRVQCAVRHTDGSVIDVRVLGGE